ncbi:MAG: hypothetical protein ABI743_09585, partial [bacterium]
PISIDATCYGDGDCPDLQKPVSDEMSAKRFSKTEHAPRRYEGGIQSADELTIYLPSGALEGETVKGSVIASGAATELLTPEIADQITINNEPVTAVGDTVKSEDGLQAAQEFTFTFTGGGGLANVGLATASGPVPLTTVTVMAAESQPSAISTVQLANVPDVFSWNTSGTALWAPGDSATSPCGTLGDEAYRPTMSAAEPTAPLITGVGGTRSLVALTDAEVSSAAAANLYTGIGFLDSLSEGYRAWAKDPYKTSAAIADGAAPVFTAPGQTFTVVAPTPSGGGVYGAQGGATTDSNGGYGAGWDPNKSTVENLVLMDPQTGAIMERIPVLANSSMMSSGVMPDGVPGGSYDVGMETSDGQVVKTGTRTVVVNMATQNDAVVQRGTAGRINLNIEGGDQRKKEDKQDDKDKDGKTLRPELRAFWGVLAMTPGDLTTLGYEPRRGSFLNEFQGMAKPAEGTEAEEGKQQDQKKQDDMWKKEEKEPEMWVTVWNMTPETIRFTTGESFVTLPIYADTTTLDIPFMGIQTGPYSVQVEVKSPESKALDPDNLKNLDPEENPLMKMAANGWDPTSVEGFNLGEQ